MRQVLLQIIFLLGFSQLLLAESSPTLPQKTVTLATLEWPPYISPQIENHGYVHELVSKVYEHAGYHCEIKFFPWARALMFAQTGTVDGLMPEYYDSSRLADFAFSSPFPGGPVGFYKHRDLNVQFAVDPRQAPEKALRGLSDYKFGIVRGYINTEAFDQANYLKKEAVVDDELNLKKLFKRRIDLIFIDKYVAQYLINTKYPWFDADLVFMEPALEKKDLYIAFSKKAKLMDQKRLDFNKALAELTENGTIDAILLKHGF